MADSHALLTGLQAQQAGAHTGQPRDLGAAMSAQERTDLLNFAHKRERELFIGAQYSNLYTAVDTPSKAAWLCVCCLCVWCLWVSMCSDVLGSLRL
jgi:hypothetical protein